MKKLLYTAGIFLACASAQLDAQTIRTWERLSLTPYRGPVSNIAIANDGKLYITTNNSVYRSTDEGRNWEIFPGSYAGNFSDLAVSRSNPSALFVGTDWHMAWTMTGSGWRTQTFKVNSHTGLGGGVGEIHEDPASGMLFSGNYMIQTSGNWMEILPGANIYDYVIEPGKPMLAIAGNSEGSRIYKSVNGGIQWSPMAAMPGYGELFHSEGKIYAQLEVYENQQNKRVFLASGDWGESWTPVNFRTAGLPAGTENVRILAVRGGKFYAALVVPGSFYTKGLYVSADEMQSWSLLHAGLAEAMPFELAFRDGKVFITTEGNGVFLYNESTQALEERNHGLFALEPQSLLPVQNSIFAFDMNGIVRSDDGGSSWKKITLGNSNMPVFAMAALPGGELLAGSGTSKYTGGSALLMSTDNGETWTGSDYGITTGTANWANVNGIQVAGEKIYALVSQASETKLFVSANKAQNWRDIIMPQPEQGQPASVMSFAVDGNGEIILGALRGFTMSSVLYHSTDDGGSWQEMNIPAELQFSAASSVRRDQNGNIYLVDAHGGKVFLRKGNSWEQVMSGPGDEAHWYFDQENNIYISSAGSSDWQGIKFSSNGGKNWEIINNGLPQNLDEISIAQIAFAADNTPYTSLSDGTIYRLELVSGVEEDAQGRNISAVPNPFGSTLGLHFDARESSTMKVALYTTLGEEVFSREFSCNEGPNTLTIPAGELAPGVYQYRLTGAGIVSGGTVIKR